MHFKNETCLQIQVTEHDTHFQAITIIKTDSDSPQKIVSMTIWNAHMKDCVT